MNHTNSIYNYELFSLVKVLFITPVNQVLSHVPVMTVTLVMVPHALMLMSAPPTHVTQMPHVPILPEVTHAPVTTVTQVMAQAAPMLMSVPQTHVMLMQAVTILQAHGGIIYSLFIQLIISLFIILFELDSRLLQTELL